MSNGAEVEEDAPWKEDEPNDAGDGEGCILSSMDGGWNDIGCTKKGYAVCQKPGKYRHSSIYAVNVGTQNKNR